MMSVTPFGIVFIILGITILIARPAWLMPLLIVSSCLHAYAIVIFGNDCNVEMHLQGQCPRVSLGVSPWLLSSGLVFVHFLLQLVRYRRLENAQSNAVRKLYYGWIAFFILSIFTAFALPFLFKGILVNSLANWAGFVAPRSPLEWKFVNAVQAVNSGIILLLIIYSTQLAKDEHTSSRIFAGFSIAALLSIGLSVLQRLQHVKVVPNFDFFQTSFNPSYFVTGMLYSYGETLSIYRLNWPFSEPSYASAWYAGILVGGFSLFLFSHRLIFGLFFFVLGLFGLLNSMGGSGLGGSIIGVFILLLLAIFKSTSTSTPNVRKTMLMRLFFWFFCIMLIITCYEIIRSHYANLTNIGRFLFLFFQEKILHGDITRTNSNIFAIEIVRNTWGLGAGLGSNRASSYLLSMISNVGIPGLIIFIIVFLFQLRMIFHHKMTCDNSVEVFLFGGTLGVFFSISLGIPDLNFPAWWIWIICGFAVLASHAVTSNDKSFAKANLY